MVILSKSLKSQKQYQECMPIEPRLNMPGSTLLFFMELFKEEHLCIYYLIKCHHCQGGKQAIKNPSDLKILLSLYLLSLSPLMIPLCVFDGSSNSSSQLALWLSHQNLERQLHASSLPIKSCLNMPGSTLLFFMELINEEHLRIYYLVKCHHCQGGKQASKNPSDLKILLSLYLLSLSPLMIPLCVFDGSSNSSSQLALWLSHQNLERQLNASSLPIKSCLNMPGSTLLFFMELINEEHLRIYYLVKCHHCQGGKQASKQEPQ